MPASVTQKSQQSKQEFYGVKRKTREPADQRAVKADVLQVAANVDFDQRNQLRHVPRFHLVGDEGRNAALLVRDETAQHRDQTLVDLAAQLAIAGKRFARRDTHTGEMMLQDLGLAACTTLDEGPRVGPHGAGEIGELGTREQIALQTVDAVDIGLVGAEPVDEA